MAKSCMNNFKISKFVVIFVCFSFGLAIFINGFIPISVTKLKPASLDSFFPKCLNIVKNTDVCRKFNSTSYLRHYEQVVLVVIDALRADFIPSVYSNSEFNTSFPFMEDLIQKKIALPFISKVQSPTVTLPRIKSLVTGGLSNFMDVLINLNAVELNEDSLLHQAKEKNLSSIFYGDNTWLKAFPGLFLRSEGTHSFFVSDFQEVDDNVTVHLSSELSERDWNIMILHYLGVDHIGHAYGPHSKFLSPKLIEMDNIIKYIFTSLGSFKTKSLIIVCGDHGMTSSGSHGGVSKSELLTPLIFISTNQPEYNKSYGVETIDQVDFAATLSVLLGLPIPANSFGNILYDVLHYSALTPHQILSAMLHNLIQLFEVHKSVLPYKKDIYIEHIEKVIINHSEFINIISKADYYTDNNYTYLLKSYVKLLRDIKQDLLAHTTGYNEVYIMFGLYIMWLSLAWATIILLLVIRQNDPCFLLKMLNFLKTTEFAKLPKDWLYSARFSIVLIKNLLQNIHLNFMDKCCVFLFLLHGLSLFSSSFIEEEHQVWYFLISTILTLCLVTNMWSIIQDYFDFIQTVTVKSTLKMGIFIRENKNYAEAILLLKVLILHRLMRSWNQTGDKWQHLSDISDWLDEEENKIYMTVLAVISHSAILFYFFDHRENMFIYYVMQLCIAIINLYKQDSHILARVFETLYMDLIILPWTVYVFITLIIVCIFQTLLFQPASFKNIYASIKNTLLAWILLILLIGRWHNAPLIAATLWQELFLSQVLWRNKYGRVFSMFSYLILAMGSFFYLGNSNSLSTIDVYSGYVGLQSYQPAIVGFLITCNTYSTVVMWIILMIYRLQIFNRTDGHDCCIEDLRNSPSQPILYSFLILLVYKLSVLAVYCIVMFIMKHHLFFLSVFAPKLFYEVCHTILTMIFMFLSTMTEIFW